MKFNHHRHCEERKLRSNPALPCSSGLLRGACHRAALSRGPVRARNDGGTDRASLHHASEALARSSMQSVAVGGEADPPPHGNKTGRGCNRHPVIVRCPGRVELARSGYRRPRNCSRSVPACLRRGAIMVNSSRASGVCLPSPQKTSTITISLRDYYNSR